MQHDYNLADAAGAAFRADGNNALSAIVSLNSGASAPSTTFADMLWVDTTNGLIKRRNAANSGWINLGPRATTMLQAKSANYTVVPADHGTVISCTNTITLALTAVATMGDGLAFGVRNDGTGVVTIDPSSTEQINGGLTWTLQPGETCTVWCNGSAFKTLGNGPGRLLNVQVFNSAGTSTYTPTAGALYYRAWVLGGGGAGGSCASTSSGQAACGGPGGGGGIALKRGLVSAISGATITVGAAGAAAAAGNNAGGNGGTSSIGAVVSSTGGNGGPGGGAGTPPLSNSSGSPGAGSGGDVNGAGMPGVPNAAYSSAFVQPGVGGNSLFGGGGSNGGVTTGAAGNGGSGFGSGGAGATNAASQSARAGGAGRPGLVIIEEYS